MSDPTKKWMQLVIAAVAAILILQVLYAVAVAGLIARPKGPGTFGDMFGGLNTFFAGLAFAGVVFTIYSQVRDAAQTRRDQAESFGLLQQQVGALRDNVELQQLRDMVEAGPFFKLDDASFTNNILTLEMINVGAPVICLDFRAVSPRAHVLQWSPSALTNNERFRAPTHLDDGQEREC